MSGRLVRILFHLDRDAWHGVATERLWAEPLGDDRYRLRNSPFYAYGVSAEDIVFGERDPEGQTVFSGTSIRGRHSTYRLRLPESRGPAFDHAWAPLSELGCTFEEGHVLAVDVPPHADINAVYAHLERGESRGVWEFEEGHCGHTSREG